MERLTHWAKERYQQGLLTKQDLQKPDFLIIAEQREPVAAHEEGHAIVARGLRWGVNFETVIPNGNTLGLTEVSPAAGKSQPELILDSIAISIGGQAGEELTGITDHSGCGSDIFKQNFLADLYIRLTGSIRSVGAIISEQTSRARSYIGSFGEFNHRQRSLSLVRACSF